MKPLAFFTKDNKHIPIMPKTVLPLPVRGEGVSILPKKQVIPDKYKELSKSYAISFGKKGREQSIKASRFALKRGLRFIEEKKLKEKLKKDIEKDIRELIHFRSKNEEKELEKILADDSMITKSPEEIAQILRSQERQGQKKKFDFEFKKDVNEEVIGGDPQRMVMITNRGNEVPATPEYYGMQSKSQKPDSKKESKSTSKEKEEVVDMYLNLLPSGNTLIQDVS